MSLERYLNRKRGHSSERITITRFQLVLQCRTCENRERTGREREKRGLHLPLRIHSTVKHKDPHCPPIHLFRVVVAARQGLGPFGHKRVRGREPSADCPSIYLPVFPSLPPVPSLLLPSGPPFTPSPPLVVVLARSKAEGTSDVDEPAK